ncbi:MAG: Do family serine endopeptidase [Cyclobacteriaceae bacterium]
MGKKQFILGVTFASFFGAVLALVLSYFFGPQEKVYIPSEANGQSVNFTKYDFDSSNYIVPEGLNFIYASKVSTPAVVHVRTKYNNYDRGGAVNPLDYFFRDNPGNNGRGSERQARGAGSGVIISSDGYIATNNHVIEGATEVNVVLGDNRSYEATVVGTDPSTDLALIKIDADKLPTVAYGDSDGIQVGEWVLAVGNPFEFRSTVTAGIVSAKGRNINILNRGNGLQIESFIQTDAAVNPGNSGGALVNLKGELVGINTAIATQTGSFSGYSFAVPANLVKKVIEDLKEFGQVQRALLGVSIRDVDAELAEDEDLPVLKGIYINGVSNNSAAEEAGIESGDVIVEIDGKTVNSVAELQETIAINRPGDEVEVTYIRDGNRKITTAKLRNTSGNTQIILAVTTEIDGAVFSELSAIEKENFRINGGVKIEEIEDGKWKDAGIREGFIITEIDKKPINDIEDLKNIINRYSDEEGVLVEGINKDGKIKYYGIDW